MIVGKLFFYPPSLFELYWPRHKRWSNNKDCHAGQHDVLQVRLQFRLLFLPLRTVLTLTSSRTTATACNATFVLLVMTLGSCVWQLCNNLIEKIITTTPRYPWQFRTKTAGNTSCRRNLQHRVGNQLLLVSQLFFASS